MTDINHDTWMLSGSAVMQDGVTLRNGYGCDLDTLTTGTRIGKGSHFDVWHLLIIFWQMMQPVSTIDKHL
jgi:hypothetical protein